MVDPDSGTGLIICVTEPGYIWLGLTEGGTGVDVYWGHAVRVATAIVYAAQQAATAAGVDPDQFEQAVDLITEETIRSLSGENDTSPAQEAELN